MKRVLFLLFILSAVSPLAAHSPSGITLSFDSESKILQAVITHPVKNYKSHFIDEVEVELNGKTVIEQSVSRQDNNSTLSVQYRIPDAEKGDRIRIKAGCSIMGSLKKEITAE